MKIFAKDILGPAKEGAFIIKEYVIPGPIRFSNRGKLSGVIQIQKTLNNLMGMPKSFDRDIIHEGQHIKNDVEGAALIAIGAYREYINPIYPKIIHRESTTRLFPIEDGEIERTTDQLIKFAEGPGDDMSTADKESVKHLKSLEKF